MDSTRRAVDAILAEKAGLEQQMRKLVFGEAHAKSNLQEAIFEKILSHLFDRFCERAVLKFRENPQRLGIRVPRQLCLHFPSSVSFFAWDILESGIVQDIEEILPRERICIQD